MQANPKFKGLDFPALRRVEAVEARYIGKIDRKGLNFMKACLAMEPERRITVEEAMMHPFLSEMSMEEGEQLMEE
jgi:cyclin-dependent kinase-like